MENTSFISFNVLKMVMKQQKMHKIPYVLNVESIMYAQAYASWYCIHN